MKERVRVQLKNTKRGSGSRVFRKADQKPKKAVPSPLEQILHLQRTLGNRAVTHLVQAERESAGRPILLEENDNGSQVRNPCVGEDKLKIDNALSIAIEWASAAKRKLENPEDVEERLRFHFKIGPGDTEEINQIKNSYEAIAAKIESEGITYHCLPGSNEFCQGGPDALSRAGWPHISFCDSFLADCSDEELAHRLLHEAAHVHDSSFDIDVYCYTSEYEFLGSDSLRNADSYACFARDVY